MLVTQKRPRVLKWFHAGPLLFGDWGTSRLYVLGLAFYYTGHASPLYLAAMSVIMAAVAWAYTVVCRCYPEGGGVYTAGRAVHPLLGVVGATLLLAGYVVTAAISVVVAFHYFGVPQDLVFLLSAITIAGIGMVNWLGARSAGRFALLIAAASLAVSVVLAVLAVPYLGAGLRQLTWGHVSVSSPWRRWESLVAIVLALSGVESVANMTGLMKQPVERTARRTIWPVLAEVVVLNMLFGIAFSGLPQFEGVREPDHIAYEVRQGIAPPADIRVYSDTAMRVLATTVGTHALNADAGQTIGMIAAVVFGLLLISAANTAVMAMVSVLYSMAVDHELPRALTRLNYSGVPWIGLVVSCVLPVAVLAVERDMLSLAELYAVGVCGAITINIVSCVSTRSLPIGRIERAGMAVIGLVMLAIALTIVATQWNATLFAASLTGAVLTLRAALHWRARHAPPPLLVPEQGWLAEIDRAPADLPPGRPRIMLAARGRFQAEFAVDLARKRGAILFAIYVRTLRVMDMTPGAVPRVQDDPGAMESLGTVAVLAGRYGVPFVPIYAASPEIAEEILDYTVTFGCDTLVMGKTRRRAFARAVEGDVVARVAQNLPSEVALITRDSTPYAIDEKPESRSEAPPT